jgi:hypothetical protein
MHRILRQMETHGTFPSLAGLVGPVQENISGLADNFPHPSATQAAWRPAGQYACLFNVLSTEIDAIE